MKVSEVLQLLHEDGWKQVRMKGSHRRFRHPSKPGTVTVAGKPRIDIPPGTLSSIPNARWAKITIKRGNTDEI